MAIVVAVVAVHMARAIDAISPFDFKPKMCTIRVHQHSRYCSVISLTLSLLHSIIIQRMLWSYILACLCSCLIYIELNFFFLLFSVIFLWLFGTRAQANLLPLLKTWICWIKYRYHYFTTDSWLHSKRCTEFKFQSLLKCWNYWCHLFEHFQNNSEEWLKTYHGCSSCSSSRYHSHFEQIIFFSISFKLHDSIERRIRHLLSLI